MFNDIRIYQDKDLTSLAEVYRDSINQTGNEYYSIQQIAAWSSFPDEMDTFEDWIKAATTFVAIDTDDACIGFGGLENCGRVSSLFVSPKYKRQGIGSRLLEQLLAEARLRDLNVVTTQASEFSMPLFKKYRFTVTEIEHTKFKGVNFARYAMKCTDINFL